MLHAPERPQPRMTGAFHAFARSVLADESARVRANAMRKRWLRHLARQAATAAEQCWEGEGGSMRRESALARPAT